MKAAPIKQLFKIATNPAFVLFFIGFIALCIFYLDPILANFFHEAQLSLNLPWLVYVTHLGLGGLYLPTFLGLALFFRYIRKDKDWEARLWFLFTAVLIPCLICLFLKVILGRARPILLFDEQLYGFFGIHFKASFWSFPSGHTTTIMSAAFALSVIFPRFFYIFITLGLTVASSRIFLTNHYLSDVLVATYLSLVEIGLLLCILQHKGWLSAAVGNRKGTSEQSLSC